jgi:hypothetical protein
MEIKKLENGNFEINRETLEELLKSHCFELLSEEEFWKQMYFASNS